MLQSDIFESPLFTIGFILISVLSLTIPLIMCSECNDDEDNTKKQRQRPTISRPLPSEPTDERKYESIDRKTAATKQPIYDVPKPQQVYDEVDPKVEPPRANAANDVEAEESGFKTPIAMFAATGQLPADLPHGYWSKVATQTSVGDGKTAADNDNETDKGRKSCVW